MTQCNPPTWRFLNTQHGNAFFNMAVDEALVRSIGAQPAFRVYGWQPPAVSFGYAQRISREVDAQKVRERGIDIVRRPTGGRAVLHWNELTYSVICPADNPVMGGNINEAYRKISEGLLAGIRALGVDATFESHRQTQPSPRGKELTAPCFTSTAQYEIKFKRRKLIGSAQQRIGTMLLQHGSLLLGPEHKQIADLLPSDKPGLKKRFARELDRHTISLSEALASPIDFNTAATAIRQGIQKTFNIQLIEAALSKTEIAETQRLIAEKYATHEWNDKY